MPNSKHQRNHARARTLETVIDVKTKTRDAAISKALEYARIASETHDQGHARAALRQRDFARWLDDGVREDRKQLHRLERGN